MMIIAWKRKNCNQTALYESLKYIHCLRYRPANQLQKKFQDNSSVIETKAESTFVKSWSIYIFSITVNSLQKNFQDNSSVIGAKHLLGGLINDGNKQFLVLSCGRPHCQKNTTWVEQYQLRTRTPIKDTFSYPVFMPKEFILQVRPSAYLGLTNIGLCMS